MKQFDRFLNRKKIKAILGDDFVLNEQQKFRLLLILDEPKKIKMLEDWLPTFAYFVKYDLTNYLGRFRRLQKIPTSSTVYALVLRYGKTEGLIRYQTYNDSKTAHFPNKKSYWEQKGMTTEQATEMVFSVQRERNQRATQVLQGTSEYTIRSAAFWLKKGYTLEEAHEKVRAVQSTNGVVSYKRKGTAFPEAMQEKRNQKWLATLAAKNPEEIKRIKLARGHSIEGIMARGVSFDEAEKQSIAYYQKRKNYSKISQKCFCMITDRLGTDGLFYKNLNYEKQFHGKNVDFFDQMSGTVIEFLGDFWHANPLYYERETLIYKKPATFVIQDDKARFRLIESHPNVRQLFFVWESEFRQNPTNTVNYITEALSLARL